jgi:hypothetical protein
MWAALVAIAWLYMDVRALSAIAWLDEERREEYTPKCDAARCRRSGISSG